VRHASVRLVATFLSVAALAGWLPGVATAEAAAGGQSAMGQTAAPATVPRATFIAGQAYLAVEVLDDDLLHFEVSAAGPPPDGSRPLAVTPQVHRTSYGGPSRFTRSGPAGTVLETASVRTEVDPGTLCLGVSTRATGQRLTTLCPFNLTTPWKGLTVDPESMQHVYGLGEEFVAPGNPNGDWTGRVRSPGDEYGNQIVAFLGGHVGNAQIPVMYALGPQRATCALFLDHLPKQRWDFTGSPWRVETWGDAIRGYVLTGPDLPAVRASYLELTGRPPVPPKKLLGLWVSEWGYDDWRELEGKLTTLRANRFPVDGFLLDLQWFGGVVRNSEDSPMGRLTWDPGRFPHARAKVAELRERHGVGVMPIEQSYVSRGLPEHADLAARGFLLRAGCPTCPPVYLDSVSDRNTGNWWGKGGMLDWTSDAAADYWHDAKRQALVDDGVLGHWTDLGEPEMYDAIDSPGDPADWAQGVLPGQHAHADWHNAYTLKWVEGIARGYRRHGVARRPFVLARSGAAGLQRHGAAMWSGDIGPDFASLATQMNVQMHLSLSGIDYFGSDIAGFYRGELAGSELDELYTRWFANSALLDVPLRPHTENLCNCRETAPDRVGEPASNLANLRQRYALVPYLYSLAHRAWREGEPVFPPLVFHYQDDPQARERGDEKMIGRDLLVATLLTPRATHRDVYLPAGEWVDYHTNEWLHSAGEVFPSRPLRREGLLRAPLFARAGAILPHLPVDDQTLNALGAQADGSVRDELLVRVYASPVASAFTLYEDDGETTAYQQGAVRTTVISQRLDPLARQVTVTIAPAQGTYAGAPDARENRVGLLVDRATATRVTLNGAELPRHPAPEALEAAQSGWHDTGRNLILTKSARLPVGEEKTFVFAVEPVPR
jgi:alpha-glucosidase